MNPDNTLYRQVSFEDGFDLISNGNDDKFIYLKEVPEQEQEEVERRLSTLIEDGFQNDYDREDNLIGVFKKEEVIENIMLEYILIKK